MTDRKDWDPCLNQLTSHQVSFMGIGYRENPDPRPGGSDRRTYYAQIFMCNNCCQTHSVPLDVTTGSFDKKLEGSFPASEDQIPASKSSRRY